MDAQCTRREYECRTTKTALVDLIHPLDRRDYNEYLRAPGSPLYHF